jgi:hypothetical protein
MVLPFNELIALDEKYTNAKSINVQEQMLVQNRKYLQEYEDYLKSEIIKDSKVFGENEYIFEYRITKLDLDECRKNNKLLFDILDLLIKDNIGILKSYIGFRGESIKHFHIARMDSLNPQKIAIIFRVK